jgi:hypothetical protein
VVLSGQAGRPARLAVPGPVVLQRVDRRPAQVRRPMGRVRDRAVDVAGPRPPQAPLRAGPGANSIRTGTVEIQPVGQEAVRPGLVLPLVARPGLARPGLALSLVAHPVLAHPVLVRRGLVRRGLVRRVLVRRGLALPLVVRPRLVLRVRLVRPEVRRHG